MQQKTALVKAVKKEYLVILQKNVDNH